MINFIEELFYGNIAPQVRSIKNNDVIQKELASLASIEKLLLNRLCGEEKKLFFDYMNTWGVFGKLVKQIVLLSDFGSAQNLHMIRLLVRKSLLRIISYNCENYFS